MNIKASQTRADRKGNVNYMDDIVGEVVFENEYFYTVQTKNYRTSVNKKDVMTGLIKVKL